MKVGRNDLCPCESGKKYKFCCEKKSVQDGIIVVDYKRKKQYTMGSPGGIIYNNIENYGDLNYIQNNIENINMMIEFDIPSLLPLIDDENYEILIENKKYTVLHKTKKRGEESFSTIDTKKLPFFSCMQIIGDAIDPMDGMFEDVEDSTYKTYKLINKIISKILIFIPESEDKEVKLPILSYEIYYYDKDSEMIERNIKLISIIPYVGKIEISDESFKLTNEENLKLKQNILKEKIKIYKYINENIDRYKKEDDFRKKARTLINNFIFYCNQQPAVFLELKEEYIRDIFILAAKIVFGNAEAEVFNFDGKLDFKISNKENNYEIITGEFKWWTGIGSFEEVLRQVTEKHFNGHELELNIIMLSRNKEIENVKNSIVEIVNTKSDILEKMELVAPEGLKEYIYKTIYKSRRGPIELYISIADLYYEKVKI